MAFQPHVLPGELGPGKKKKEGQVQGCTAIVDRSHVGSGRRWRLQMVREGRLRVEGSVGEEAGWEMDGRAVS